MRRRFSSDSIRTGMVYVSVMVRIYAETHHMRLSGDAHGASLCNGVCCHEEVAEFEKHAGTHVCIPGIFAGAHLVEVEGNDAAAALADLVEEIVYLLGFEAALHGCAGVGTKLRVEAIDIEGDMHLVGQLRHDLLADGL